MSMFMLPGSPVRRFLLLLLLAQTFTLKAQRVGVGTNSPHPSAQLDVSSTERGFLIPRMSYAQILAVANPSAGLQIWCTNCNTTGQMLVFTGQAWEAVSFTAVVQPVLTGAHTCGTPNVHNTASGISYGSMNDQEGNIYKTIQIGTQTWMAENLKSGRYRNGDIIPTITSNGGWANSSSGASSWMNNDSAANACPYGRIYNRFAVVDSRGLCPSGWHVPSDAEFNTLSNFLGGTAQAGGKLKSTSTLWQSPNTGANNSSGFSALPGGSRAFNDGSFSATGNQGYWWSSTNFISNLNYYYALLFNDGSFVRDFVDEKYGFSVRCVKD
jgi:uncharacterized protein (TIGR02145 family)